MYLKHYCLEVLYCFLFLLSQSKKEKRICPEAGPTEALGVVPRFGSDDIIAMESGDWPTWTNRSRRVAR